jgi:hypothetical protein
MNRADRLRRVDRAGPLPRRSRSHAVSLALVGMSLATVCHAERPRIAVAHRNGGVAARRLFAEVRNGGFDPVDVLAKHIDAVAPSRMAEKYGVVAVLSLGARGNIDVAVMSPETGRIVYASTVTSKGGTPASVRAVEELHGRLVAMNLATDDVPATKPSDTKPAETKAAESNAADGTTDDGSAAEASPQGVAAAEASAPERTEPAATEPVRPLHFATPDPERDVTHPSKEPDRRDRVGSSPELWLGAGAGLTNASPRLNRVGESRLEVRFAPSRYVALSALAFLPLSSQNIAVAQGGADVRARVVGGLFHVTPIDIGDRFFIDAAIGGGAALVEMNGHAASPILSGRNASVTTGIGLGAIGASFRALPWLAVRVDATGGLAVHRPVVQLESQDVAAWGPGFAAVTAGLEIDAARIAREAVR